MNRKLRRLIVLVTLGNEFHSGQCSRGYRLMCLAIARLRRYGVTRPLDHPWQRFDAYQRAMWNDLTVRYKGKL